MTDASLKERAGRIAASLRDEAAEPPFKSLDELTRNEVLRLRGEGRTELADALAAVSEGKANG